MQPAGLREVERAKADGRWAASYEPQSKASAPPDLVAALAKNKQANTERRIMTGNLLIVTATGEQNHRPNRSDGSGILPGFRGQRFTPAP